MEQNIKILSGLLGIVSSFYIFATVVIFLHCFYDRNFQWTKKKAILLFFLAFFENISIMFCIENILLETLVIISYPIIAIYDYQGNKMRGAFRFLKVYFVSVLCITSAAMVSMYCILPNYDIESEELNVMELLIVNVIGCVFFGVVFHYLYERIYKQGLFIPCGKREKIFTTAYTVVSLVFFCLIFTVGKNDRIPLVIMAFSVIVFATMFPIGLYYTRISEYYRERTQYQEVYIHAELAHFQQYKQAQEETRRFRHDIRNNLLCMNEMLKNGKTQETIEYLESLLDTANNLSTRYVSGDEILDCIIASKVSVMEKKDISFSLDGVLAGGLSWKPVDICSVFANALDNSIEACEKLPKEQRKISLKIKATPRFWFVNIQNPVEKNVDTGRLFLEKGGYTSKNNSGQHGMGTYNMKHTVESYGGMLKAECSDNQFVLEIMIDKSNVTFHDKNATIYDRILQ